MSVIALTIETPTNVLTMPQHGSARAAAMMVLEDHEHDCMMCDPELCAEPAGVWSDIMTAPVDEESALRWWNLVHYG